MGGLGLDQFLTHGDSAGRKFHANWKEKGEVTVWLSTRAEMAYAAWSHPFVMHDTYTNKEDEEVAVLRFPRFVSPDPEVVHMSQHFREKDDGDVLQIPPVKDPFLILREYLRFECEDMPLNQVIFRWENPMEKAREKVIEWNKGEISRLVKRGQSNYGHSLDTKLDYMFVIVDDNKPDDGLQISRVTKMLGDKMKTVIGEEMESNGEKGNPLLSPYAFRWKYDENANMADMYRAFRFNQAKLTDKIREAIESKEYPDPSPDTVPKAGDKSKIRAAMEDAAQVDLPWERLFVDEWDDDEGSSKSEPKKESRTPEVNTKTKDEGKPQRRRKKVKEPEPEPEVERIKCDDCDNMLLPTDAKCSKCGAEYEVDEDVAPAPAKAKKSAKLETKQAETSNSSGAKCFSCGDTDIKDNRCNNCGIDQGDDVPF